MRLANALERSICRKDLIADVLGVRFNSKAVPLVHQLLNVHFTEVWIGLLQIVIKGVIDAEEAAIEQYEKIIRLCDGYDYVTQDMCITLLADEQQHRREFVGFLKEYESQQS